MASLKQDLNTIAWLKQHREPYEDTIEDIKSLCFPWRFDLDTGPDPESEQISGSFDSMAVNEADALTNFVVGNVFPPSGDWLRLVGRNDDDQHQAALDEASEAILGALARSNFYQQAALALRDLVVIGNSNLYMEARPSEVQRDGSTFAGIDFEAVPFNRVWRLVDRMGRPLIVARCYKMRAFEAELFFTGPRDSFSFRGDPMEEIEFIQLIRREKDGITSRWIRMDIEKTVREGRYTFMPCAISRWDVVDGEQYGVGRGHLARPTAAGRNELKRQILMAAGRDLGPSLMVEHDSLMNVDRAAHGLLILRASTQNRPEYLNTNTNYQIAQQVAMEDAEQIRRAFLTDLIGEPEGGVERSAEGVRVRQARIVQAVAGPAQAIATSFLTPVVETIVGHMVRGGALPMLEELDGVEATFVSPFFTLQKQQAVQKVADFLAFKSNLQQMTGRDDLLDDVDFDAATSYIGKHSDIPAFLLKDPTQARQARAEVAAMEKAMEAGQMPGAGPEQPETPTQNTQTPGALPGIV